MLSQESESLGEATGLWRSLMSAGYIPSYYALQNLRIFILFYKMFCFLWTMNIYITMYIYRVRISLNLFALLKTLDSRGLKNVESIPWGVLAIGIAVIGVNAFHKRWIIAHFPGIEIDTVLMLSHNLQIVRKPRTKKVGRKKFAVHVF